MKALSHVDRKPHAQREVHLHYMGPALLRNVSRGCSLVGAPIKATEHAGSAGSGNARGIPDPFPRGRVGLGPRLVEP